MSNHATTGLRHRNDTFPSKLYEILSNPEYSQIISWLPHGKTWKVHNNMDFEKQIMPKYFTMTAWSSFARQVNGWGFCRILIAGMDRGSYHNQLFSRDRPDLVKFMRRRTRSTAIQEATTSMVLPSAQYPHCVPKENMRFTQSPICTGMAEHNFPKAEFKATEVSYDQSACASNDFARILDDVSTPSSNPSIDFYSPVNDSSLDHNNYVDSNLYMEAITAIEDVAFESVCSEISDEMSDFDSSPLMDNLDYGNIIDAHKRKRFPFGQYN